MKNVYAPRKCIAAVILFTIIAVCPVYAERFAVGIKFCSFSSHPKGSPNAPLMPYKFDEKGLLVFNPGVSLNMDYFIFDDLLSIKAVQGLYGDCALQFLGYTHLGFRVRFLKLNRFSMNIGIGPTLIYRQSWYKLKGYDIAEKFLGGTPSEDWEYSLIWYGGEIECNVCIFDKTDISVGVVPAGIDLLNINIGLRFRFGA